MPARSPRATCWACGRATRRRATVSRARRRAHNTMRTAFASPAATAALAARWRPSPSAAKPPRRPVACSPPGELRTANVESERRADGTSEITEYLARGEYRVTRCDKEGELVVSQTVSPIRAPGRRRRARPDGDRAARRDGLGALRRSRRPGLGRGLQREAGAPERGHDRADRAHRGDAGRAHPARDGRGLPRPAGARVLGGLFAQAAASNDACTNPQFRTLGGTFKTRKYRYYINRKRFNYNATTSGADRPRPHELGRDHNSCGLNDTTNLGRRTRAGPARPSIPTRVTSSRWSTKAR